MQTAERPNDLLHLVPRGDTRPNLGLQRLGDVEGVGPLGTPTAAVRLGQRAEHDARGQLVQASEEGGTRRASGRH
jgi:hypothetical protein